MKLSTCQTNFKFLDFGTNSIKNRYLQYQEKNISLYIEKQTKQ